MSLKDHKYEESIDYFQRAIEEGGASDKIYSNLGLAYKKIGRLWEAEAAFAKSIEMNPNRLEALINLGHLYYEKNVFKKL
jgi:tetratricopeptide (TPR) repeat protein